jgi:hypothetical protein
MSVRSCNRALLLAILLPTLGVGCSSEPDGSNDQSDGPLLVEILSGPGPLTNERRARFEFACDRPAGCEFVKFEA